MLILEASAGEIIYVQMDGDHVVCPQRSQEYGRNVRGYKRFLGDSALLVNRQVLDHI